ncbi:OmpW/AlkL family protein [Thalassotalea agarivorans]|uniref:Outer membrane protein n=1 Tax=Thalassotalea agarivorans TaxID=349064 RepID=A0A1I0GEK6_THASX|nr:OmpW family outer membrane protein [Thalassotalea agarivorans]SET69348.1 outer membrane protein [Thalassotalea agarivorans]
MFKRSILSVALATTLFSTPLLANQAGDIYLRGGITNVSPNSDQSAIFLADTDSTMSLSVGDDTQLGLNFVYFFTAEIALEVLAATPFTHDITLHDPQAVLGADGIKLAEVTHLPPTLSALYYFNTEGRFQPYVGVGVNYTIFFDESFTQAPKDLGLSNLSLDGSFGIAGQIGADYHIDDSWHVNASIRYINIETDASFDVAGDAIGSSSVDINPVVYSLMVGYTF